MAKQSAKIESGDRQCFRNIRRHVRQSPSSVARRSPNGTDFVAFFSEKGRPFSEKKATNDSHGPSHNNGPRNRGLAPCRSRTAHVDLAGDGGGDQSRPAFLQQLDPTLRFGSHFGERHGASRQFLSTLPPAEEPGASARPLTHPAHRSDR